MFRSQKMGLYNLVIPRECAWNMLDELGQLSCLHFIDMNPAAVNLSRPYTAMIKRCDESLVKLATIQAQMIKLGVPIEKNFTVSELLSDWKFVSEHQQRSEQMQFREIEQFIATKEKELAEQVQHYEELLEDKNFSIEYKEILNRSQIVLGHEYFKEHLEIRLPSDEEKHPLGYNPMNNSFQVENSSAPIHLNYLNGIISREDAGRFEKMIFRVAKGNVITIVEDLNVNEKSQKIFHRLKNLYFLLFLLAILSKFYGTEFKESATRLVLLIGTQIQLFYENTIQRYQIPQSMAEFEQMLKQINERILEQEHLIHLTKVEIIDQLHEFASQEITKFSLIFEYKLFLLKEKAIYYHMNFFKQETTLLYGKVWCPKIEEEKVLKAMSKLQEKDHNVTAGQLIEIPWETEEIPPTYFKTNNFTFPFQLIVNTYGFPRYREFNPGIFTIITFPYLFGIMFGDILHGFILLIIALFLIWKQNQSALKALVPYRYLILLMGLFSFYNGFIYNDFTSLTFNLFGSCYSFDDPIQNGNDLEARKTSDCAYPFGLDPMLDVANNNLTFQNSLKMKLSVLFGVIQMLLGIALKGFNTFHFGQWIDFFFEFLPQFIFMIIIFGYMNLMIVIKWLTDWTGNTACAPDLIQQLMNLFLKVGGVYQCSTTVKLHDGTSKSVNIDGPLWGDGSSQKSIQIALILIAILCIPIMLFVKPILYGRKRKLKQLKHNVMEKESEGTWINQLIETIEFVLGSISNTASYLRLWALSLAHSQLSGVFYDKGVNMSIKSSSGVFVKIFILIIGYFVFANFTFAVLMCMDSMECFLHALRLHWVEFQNKFYKADGYEFIPFSIEKELKKELE